MVKVKAEDFVKDMEKYLSIVDSGEEVFVEYEPGKTVVFMQEDKYNSLK